MKRRDFITLLGGAMSHCWNNTIFALNIAFALVVIGLITVNLVAAEYAATGGNTFAAHHITTSPERLRD